ncbi:uncharacterized protein B0I36DRAFT_370292 [Microdochium trichocladiopsis]|uniref:Uncharacterized protein n=1 Tax=Microdochium trichocladiopsis TaxID=1682393 RepID=A0A9P9BKP1_9PEZI|nr:uncharacterized protein B0I36DRAFT_370292 [Microdochium trichocladiopsis]KAH7010698.1 hypothetical protein B0I36DRAFT_370292 [Microdochium trichocladiopsis]
MSPESYPVEEKALSEALAQVVRQRAERTPSLSRSPRPDSVDWRCQIFYHGLSEEEIDDFRSTIEDPQYWATEAEWRFSRLVRWNPRKVAHLLKNLADQGAGPYTQGLQSRIKATRNARESIRSGKPI